jgi:hypothetical protein
MNHRCSDRSELGLNLVHTTPQLTPVKMMDGGGGLQVWLKLCVERDLQLTLIRNEHTIPVALR